MNKEYDILDRNKVANQQQFYSICKWNNQIVMEWLKIKLPLVYVNSWSDLDPPSILPVSIELTAELNVDVLKSTDPAVEFVVVIVPVKELIVNVLFNVVPPSVRYEG